MTRKQFRILCRKLAGAYASARFSGRDAYYVGTREFASYVVGDTGPDTVQPGIHLRYDDPSFLDDPRVEPCRVHRGKHNWYYLQQTVKDAELKRLVEVSHRVSQRREGGKAADGQQKLYPPLRKALEAVKGWAEAPAGPFHAAGPLPKVTGLESDCALEICVFSAETVRHLVSAKDKETFEVLLDMATRQKRPWYETLWRHGEVTGDESDCLITARAASGARGAHTGGYSQRAVGRASEATAAAARALTEADELSTLGEFIVGIDERVMHWEFRAAAIKKGKVEDPDAIERVLWRGADEKGYPALWLVREGEGRYALLAKLGRRWTWTRGSRDDVLATVPDEHFEDAAENAFLRDVVARR